MRVLSFVIALIFISVVTSQSFRVNPDQKPKQCGVRNPFTNAQIVDALYWHNKPRRERAKAGQCANMLEAIWDHNVAAVAQNWADRCPPGHNHSRKRDYGRCTGEGNRSGSIGENWAMVSGLCPNGAVTEESGACSGGSCSDERCSMQNMIYKMWVNSEGRATGCFPYPKGGHCTQVVWGDSEFLGCGLSHCKGGRFDQTILLCNYAPPGNRNLPRKNCVRGAACSKCPSTHPFCNDGLCSRFNGGGNNPRPQPQPQPRPDPRPNPTSAPEPTSRPLPDPITPAANFAKQSGKHCYHERLRGSNASARSIDQAKQLCSQNSQCGGIYDSGCDSQGTIYLCKKGFSPRSSRSSCVYLKSGSNSNGGGNNNNNNNRDNRNNNNNNGGNRNTRNCPSQCTGNRRWSGTCKGCISRYGWCGTSSRHCHRGSIDCRQCSSSPAPAPRPNPRPSPNTGGKCMTAGSCSNTVSKCGHCLYSSQCAGRMYCCPFMKKCVENGRTPCFTPIANCIPPCRESTSGYPGTCKCDNRKFPNNWMTSGAESAVGDEMDESDSYTSEELQATFEEYKDYLVEKAVGNIFDYAIEEVSVGVYQAIGEPVEFIDGVGGTDEIPDVDKEETVSRDWMEDEEEVSSHLMAGEEAELLFAPNEVVTSDSLRLKALEFFTEEELAEFEFVVEEHAEMEVGTISSPPSSTPEIHHHHHHPMNTFDQTIALFLAGMCAGIMYMNRNKIGQSASRVKSGYSD